MFAGMVPSSSSTAMCPAGSAMRSSGFFCGQLQQRHFLTARAPRVVPTVVRPAFPAVEAKAKTRRENRVARHDRIRKKVEGTPERPRMSVFRSNKHLYVQVIDDTKMHTLASASTMQKPVSEEFDYPCGPTIPSKTKLRSDMANLFYKWTMLLKQ